MKKVIVHLGVHKTATTFVQGELASQAQYLSDNGVLYTPLRQVRKSFTYQLGKAATGKLVKDLLGDHPNVVISDENLLGKVNHLLGGDLYSSGLDNVREVLAELGEHQVSVVITLREATAFLPSMYSEYLRHYSFVSFEEYTDKVGIDNLDWYKLLAPFISLHPDVSFKIFDFNAFSHSKDKWLQTLSFDKLTNFEGGRAKSRSTITAQAIQFLAKFPNKSVDVLRKMESTNYMYGDRFSPYSQLQCAESKSDYYRQLAKLNSLNNVELMV